MFRALICPSSGVCIYVVVLSHWLIRSRFVVLQPAKHVQSLRRKIKAASDIWLVFYSSANTTSLHISRFRH